MIDRQNLDENQEFEGFVYPKGIVCEHHLHVGVGLWQLEIVSS